jgi:hypothetical protein
MITIGSIGSAVIDGQVEVDQSERRWSFVPRSPWTAGVYHIRVGSNLEDVCGNNTKLLLFACSCASSDSTSLPLR